MVYFEKTITSNFHNRVKEESRFAAYAIGNFAKSRRAAFVAKFAMAYYPIGGMIMNKRIFDIIDELTKPAHHWSWYQLNGKSAEENYALQKAEWRKQYLGRELKQLLLEEEARRAEEIANIQFTIKSEIK